MHQKNILINAPSFDELGGVANHYKGLSKYFSNYVRYHTVGSRKKHPGIFYLPYDIICFIFKICFFKVNIVVLNPSLSYKAVRRDEIFLRIARFFNKKVVVFFHGWDRSYEKTLQKNPKKILGEFYKADAFLVLAKEFKNKLIDWGIDCPIYLTSTKVDDALLKGFDINSRDFTEINLLFLSRIEKNKGIFEALDAVMELKKKNINGVSLTVVGDGPALNEARQYAVDNKLSNVDFKGRLDGDDLAAEFRDNNIYLFPSYHGEGMPTSVLEAMAFGMPIVTTANAGLKDVFENEKMGRFCKMRNSNDLVKNILCLITLDNLPEISRYNFYFAKNHFMASKVAKKLEKVCENV